jgi:hypothetical protein
VYYRIDNGFGEGVANIVIGKATGTVWMWFEGRSEDHQAVLTEEVPEGLRLCVVAAGFSSGMRGGGPGRV